MVSQIRRKYMWPFKKKKEWYKVVSIKKTPTVTGENPISFLDELNTDSDLPISWDHFSWQDHASEGLLCWAYFESNKDCKKFRKFVRKCPKYKIVTTGYVRADNVGSINWGKEVE
tara:strand:- start:132 stop:476 length:345 start_codon:yes stop_codon:yes gene_type:complete